MSLSRAGQALKGSVSRQLSAAPTRSIHIPRRLVPPGPGATNLAHRTRTFFNRLIAQLTAPATTPARRSYHVPQSLRQPLFSSPARIAPSRPLHAPCLPRAPHVPGNITQVGLGTARNFSSGRPIFQHLIENVPVAGRAFYQVDLDIKKRQELNTKFRRPTKEQSRTRSSVGRQVITTPEFITAPSTGKENEEIAHYFQAPVVTSVSTYLQIPLAPTPTSRVPLNTSSPVPHLLPLPALAKEHVSHSKHSIRVSSLFRRLDAARVWENGASCETFGDPSGLCTILRIKFEGWTEQMVKEVLGDAGRGWCTIQEIPNIPVVGERDLSSESSILSRATSPVPISLENDSATTGISLVMPTLDVSTPFVDMDSLTMSWASLPSSPTFTSSPFMSLTSSPVLSPSPMLSDVESDYAIFPASGTESAWVDESNLNISSSEGSSLINIANEWSSPPSHSSNTSNSSWTNLNPGMLLPF